MPEFAYQARSGGDLVQGVRQGGSAAQIASELIASGLVPVEIVKAKQVRKARKKRFGTSVSLKELVIFSHQMASLTRAGISVVRAVQTLSESVRNEHLAGVLTEIALDLEGGKDMASSLGRHDIFSELYISTIHIGENTGRMDEAFKRMAGYLELEQETKRRISSATRYPAFVLGAMFLAVVVLNIWVIPSFADVFAKYGADLPWQTQAIIGVSDFFVAFWPLLMVCAVIGSALAYRYLQTPTGRLRWDTLKLSLPFLGSIYTRIYLARFCRTYAMVSRAGVPLVQGLTITARAIGNERMAQKIEGMRDGIERGESVSVTSRQAGIFSAVVLQMIRVGEETGSIDDLLEQAAGFYEEEVDYELRRLTEALEPVLIIGIAVLVLIMALGVFLPLWDLNSVAN